MHERLYPAFLLAVMAGMRRGEIIGLKWNDIDLDSGIISIRRSIVTTSEGPLVTDVKTEKSKRAVSISQAVVKVLKAHHLVQAEEVLSLGLRNIDGWVFTRATEARPPYPTDLRDVLNRTIARTNLPKISFHDLLHTHVTHFLSQGVNPIIVQERLGH